MSSIGTLSERPSQPLVEVSEISQTAATIRFHSEYDDSVTYSFRYRRETGDDDDEKGTEWMEQTLDNGVDRYTLKGLQRKRKYQLIGKLIRNMVSSSDSDLISFQTMDYGPYEWDSARKHSSITLSDNNRTLTSTANSWSTVVSKYKVSLQSIKSLEWEITIRDLTFGIYCNGMMMLGFCESSAVQDVRMNKCLGQSDRPAECTLLVDKRFFAKFEKDNLSKFDSKWKGSDCKSGDRVLLKFQGSVCTVFWNEAKIGTLKKDLPAEIYLAACLPIPVTLETTKFVVIPKV